MTEYNYHPNQIVQTEPFHDPSVRFIRKNGHIVPIVNKQHLGRNLAIAGGAVVAAGAAVVGARKVVDIAKSETARNMAKRFWVTMATMPPHPPAQPINNKVVRQVGSVITKTLDKTYKGAKWSIRNPYKAGAGLLAFGTAAATLGAVTQAGDRGFDIGGKE